MAQQIAQAGAATGQGHRSGRAQQSLDKRIKKWDLGKNIVLIILVILTFYPFIAMLFMSVKDNSQFYHERWIPSWPMHFENFGYAWTAIHQ